MKARAYKQYSDPFDEEGRLLVKAAKALVIDARTEEDRTVKARELKRVLEYVRRYHLRVNEDVHARSGAELLLPSMEGRKPLQ